ncbi:hypothetical protein UlMin_032087 [Ulmus minor]
MGKIVERKKKKKGRPSLLDLQKRNLKEQQQEQEFQQQHQKRNNSNSAPVSSDNYRTATPVRRSTRRNPIPEADSPEKGDAGDEDEDEDDELLLAGKRREKKLKLVLRLPPNQNSSLNSGSLNSGGEDSVAEEDNAASISNKKRKINAIGDGSTSAEAEKVDKSTSGTNTFQGATKLDSGPSTRLPDRKLLLFILDRIQKKDTYGVFSEPVDPEELPDYHEVIEHPMDFATVRKKLTSGAHATLEDFEKDVFLISSNAMQYNAPDTIYFRQARAIHELAKKSFENLRQDSDGNEQEIKVVRRGRPPTKNLKKPLGRPPLERTGSEFSSDATLATVGENNTPSNHDLRKGSHLLDKSGLAESSGRLYGSRSSDVHMNWLADNKFERNDEFTGSTSRASLKNGKKQFVLDENRRNTYMQLHASAGGREPSVLATFDGERKMLMPVGVFIEHGYARSLARFAANLGPIAWNIAAKKIERSLPGGVKFGRGWVGENDVTQHRGPLLATQGQASLSQSFSVPANSASAATSCTVESKGDKLSEKPEENNLSEKQGPSSTTTEGAHLTKSVPLSTTTSASLANKSPEPLMPKVETSEGLKPHTGVNMPNSNVGAMRPRAPFPTHQGPHLGMNGLNGTYGFNLAAQMEKFMGSARPAGLNIHSPQMLNPTSRNNSNFVHPPTANNSNSEEPELSEHQSTKNPRSLPNRSNEAPSPSISSGSHPRPSWQGLSPQPKSNSGFFPQQKPDSVPPDLNVRFQSPGSPSSSRVDSTQPDLVLQL